MFAVVACPRCRRARVVAQGRRQATCGACNKVLPLPDLRTFHRGEDLEDARQAAGLLNARLAGREAEFGQAFTPPPPRAVRHDDPWAAAAADARHARGETPRVDRIAASLTRAMGSFGVEDLARAMDGAGVPPDRAARHVARMLAAHVLHEPRSGRYRAL